MLPKAPSWEGLTKDQRPLCYYFINFVKLPENDIFSYDINQYFLGGSRYVNNLSRHIVLCSTKLFPDFLYQCTYYVYADMSLCV
jgi:hypothetical protein